MTRSAHAAGVLPEYRYRTIPLATVDLERLVPVKVTLSRIGEQDHNRWVFRSSRGRDREPLFYKIWNASYVRRDNILAAIDCGFIDDQTVPAFDGILVHDGLCRGYVMRPCERARGMLDERYRQLIYDRTRYTRHFLVQLSDHHVMRYEGAPSLVDLEGIYPLAALPELQRLNCRFEDPDYARLVRSEFRRDSRSPGPLPESWFRGRATGKQRVARRVLRRLKRAVRNRIPRKDLIQL